MSIEIVNLAIEIKNAAEQLEVRATQVPPSDNLAAAYQLHDLATKLIFAAQSKQVAERLRSQSNEY